MLQDTVTLTQYQVNAIPYSHTSNTNEYSSTSSTETG